MIKMMGTNSATTQSAAVSVRLSGVELAVHPVCLRKGDEKLVKNCKSVFVTWPESHRQNVTRPEAEVQK